MSVATRFQPGCAQKILRGVFERLGGSVISTSAGQRALAEDWRVRFVMDQMVFCHGASFAHACHSKEVLVMRL